MTFELSSVQAAASAERLYRVATGAIVLALAVIVLVNAHRVSPALGYDAVQHQDYTRLLVEERRIPGIDVERRAAYNKPPGFYAVAGVAEVVGGSLGLQNPTKAVQYLNALLLLGAALLVFALARMLWPDRRVLHVAALGFFAFVPVGVKTASMYHPGTLALLVATASVYVTVRMLARRDFRLRLAFGLALLLLLGLIVMVSFLWVYGAIGVTLLAALAAGHASRRKIAAAIAVILLTSLLAASPWFIRQAVTYGNPLFGLSPPLDAPWKTRPLEFYGTGVPEVLTEPYRPAFRNVLVPTAYADLWGDYFGVFAWNSAVDERPPPAVAVRLVMQSWIGIVPTALALAGWLGLLAASLRRRALARAPAELLVGVLAALGLLGFFVYATNAVTVDGDTLKATYMLTTAPAWALAFGFAVDRILERPTSRLVGAVFLAASVVASLPFLLAG